MRREFAPGSDRGLQARQQLDRRRATCWLRSTRGWPRAWTLPISSRPRWCWRSSRQDGGTYRRVLEGPSRWQEGRERGCAPPSICLHLAR